MAHVSKVFNASQPVRLSQGDTEVLLLVKNKTWLVKAIWYLIQLKWHKLKKNHCVAITLIKLLR